jgi:two-component system OmpR family response regulator
MFYRHIYTCFQGGDYKMGQSAIPTGGSATASAADAVADRAPSHTSRARSLVILIGCEDDAWKDQVSTALARAGFEVRQSGSCRNTLALTARERASIVICGPALQDSSLQDFLADIRTGRDCGLIVAGHDDDLMERVLCLEMGADDYFVEHVAVREVVARVRSLARRLNRSTAPSDTAHAAAYLFEGWQLDCVHRTLRSPAGNTITITSREFEVLEALVRNSNTVVPRSKLSGGNMSDPASRAIDATVGRLRRKLTTDGSTASLIKPVRNNGYVLAASVQRQPS